ncbi:hypothetical protein [Oceanirhabdus sp. W0125-5]|uniref:hypothetical protein n=1 Tax=Oceanirhabdus sp. W0125-5 TaxID=2999116 RepID=UPI0022F2D406|nr:hypothetical protein [Oceanirhabdus sp. W0125-5]WBW95467.1 hypothetical protein OW730_17455 [Oceanirhabdus sp. W0125-5]
MEHKLNKVDLELIQKIIDITKDERVNSIRRSEKGNIDYKGKEKPAYHKKISNHRKKIVVDAYKEKKTIIINATKEDDNLSGKYLNKKR